MNHGDAPLAPPSAILETCLHVADLARARAFYSDLFGYHVLKEDARFCAFAVAEQQILILFLREDPALPMKLPFGVIPPHRSTGQQHVGFSIREETLPAWRARLAERQIPIESTFQWPAGGISIYFRDPDGHLLELLTPGVWPNY